MCAVEHSDLTLEDRTAALLLRAEGTCGSGGPLWHFQAASGEPLATSRWPAPNLPCDPGPKGHRGVLRAGRRNRSNRALERQSQRSPGVAGREMRAQRISRRRSDLWAFGLPGLPSKACRRQARARAGARSANPLGLDGGLKILSPNPFPPIAKSASPTAASPHPVPSAATTRPRSNRRVPGKHR